MKTSYTVFFLRMRWFTLLTMLLTLNTMVQATTYIIQFGGTFGLNYSPNTLSVSVGDSIQWQGSFSTHPLSSTSVPPGALSFHQGSGTVFTYPVLVAGTYDYQCDVHFGSGMVGSFDAQPITNINSQPTFAQPTEYRLDQNFPNPFNPTTNIEFSLERKSQTSLRVFDLLGHEIEVLVNSELPVGTYHIIWNASQLPSGLYFYQLRAGNFLQTRKMLLVK